MKLKIAHLYANELNIYGDRGNILTLVRRCQWRGIEVSVSNIGIQDHLHPDEFDLYFIGGGQDTQQIAVCEDLQKNKGSALKAAVQNQAVFLTICGGYQLLGHYYQPHQGEKLPGLGLIDAHTVAGHTRLIGNVTIRRSDGSTLVGFENHSGLTYLSANVSSLGRVEKGYGNNGQDKQEGAVVGNLYGTYLHGSLLPKNPLLADELILKSLQRRYHAVNLEPLSDLLENKAHERALVLK